MANRDFSVVADTILRYPACLILTHVNPEGDAIGSMLALALALEQRGIAVTCYDRDGVPENNRFLPTWERVREALPQTIPPLVIYVDADRIERCGVSMSDLAGAEAFVRIDHHVSTGEDPGPSVVDTTAAAAGELIAGLIPILGVIITPAMATCLQTALMVDTGRFSYSNTTPTTLRIAADLVAAGADVPTIVDWVWGRVKLSTAKLLGRVLDSVVTSDDGRVAWGVLRADDFTATGASQEETDGIIDAIRSLRGVEVAMLFSEKNGETRVSLRSHGVVDVARLARQFGGGGHVKAAGLSYSGAIDQAVVEVTEAVCRAFPCDG